MTDPTWDPFATPTAQVHDDWSPDAIVAPPPPGELPPAPAVAPEPAPPVGENPFHLGQLIRDDNGVGVVINTGPPTEQQPYGAIQVAYFAHVHDGLVDARELRPKIVFG